MSQEQQVNNQQSPIATQRAKRGANWSVPEDQQLCISWAHVSTDSEDGNNQRATTFWGKVKADFDANIGENKVEDRTIPGLLSRWNTVNSKLSKFAGVLSQIERRNASGEVVENKIQAALSLYLVTMKNKHFDLMHCWLILGDNPKWRLYTEEKNSRANNASRSAPVSEAAGDDDGEAPNSAAINVRPVGRKQAKESNGQKRKFEEILEKLSDLIDRQTEAMRNEQTSFADPGLQYAVLNQDLSTVSDPIRREGLRLLQLEAVEALQERRKSRRVETQHNEAEEQDEVDETD